MLLGGLIGFWFGHYLLGVVYGGLGCLLGLLLDPDLDQDTMMTSSEVRAKRILLTIPILGHIAFAVWFGWWTVYGLCHKHRGISHTPILGTLTRMLWLAPLWIVLYVRKVEIDPLMALCLFAGLVISDIGHYLRDYYGLQL